MSAHLKSFMRNSDVYKKKIKCPFWSLKIRGVTLFVDFWLFDGLCTRNPFSIIFRVESDSGVRFMRWCLVNDVYPILMLLNVLSEVDISKLNEAMFMMIIDNCWWLEMMIIWLWICLNEEYMYMYIWLDKWWLIIVRVII